MNCTEFRDNTVAHAEHVLDATAAAEYERHLDECGECRQEHAALERLHQRLAAHAQVAAGVSVTPGVMHRIHHAPTPGRRVPGIRLPLTPWLGVGAAAAALLALAFVTLSPDSNAQAAGVMTRGIQAAGQLTSVHLQARMRTGPAENFASISPNAEFVSIELWKELDGLKRWRIEKPGRVAAMDGAATMMFLRPTDTAIKTPIAAAAAFDTGWLHAVANIEKTLTHALRMAETRGWKMELVTATDAAGVVYKLVSIDTAGAGPGDYLHNKFLGTADTRRLFRFDDRTGRLETLQIYVRDSSDFRLVFEVTRINYNEPIADSVFQIELPANVTWSERAPSGVPPSVANNEKYAAMTPQQAAREFFEACGREDWAEAAIYFPMPLNERFRAHLGGLALISVGEPFTSAGSPSHFVPCEIRLRNGGTRKLNLALQKPAPTSRWLVSGGL